MSRFMPLRRLSFLFACLALTSGALQAATLKIATLAPEGSTWMQEMRAGAAEIAQRTGGRVELKFYPGGVMGNDKSVLRKIRINQLQGGAVTSGVLADAYPDIDVYELPFLFRDNEEVAYVRARMDGQLKAGLEKTGFVALGITNGGFAYLLSNKRVAGVADLDGQKVWIPEGDMVSEVVFKTAGISPVSLPVSDVYTGLQTGLIDTVVATPAAAIALQWHTRMTHLTNQPLALVIAVLAVDKKALDRLDPADQAVVREVIGRVFAHLDELNQRDDRQALEALKRQGIQFVDPSPEEVARWQDIARQAEETLGAQGAYSPATLQTLRGYLAEYRNGERDAR